MHLSSGNSESSRMRDVVTTSLANGGTALPRDQREGRGNILEHLVTGMIYL